MNNPASKAIDQAEKIITDIFENGTHDKDTGEGLYRAITLIADIRSAISDDDISAILCSAADISRQFKFVTTLHQQSFDITEVESLNFNMACLIATLSHQLCKTIKEAENLT